MTPFNPYHKWLGIPLDEQPANHYRLLGIGEFESDPDVIEGAAERQTVYLRSFQTGPNSELAERLLNEVSEARVCLLDEGSKAGYDQQLRGTLEPAPEEDPLAFTAEELGTVASRASTRQRSRKRKPFWQEPWAMPAAAGGIVVVLLLLMLLSSGGDKSLPVGKQQGPATAKVDREPKIPDKKVDEEREAELKRLAEEKTEQDRLAAAEKLTAEKLTAEKLTAEKLAAEKLAAEKFSFEKLAAELAVAKAAMEKAAKEKLAAEKVTAETVVTLQGHSSPVRSVAWSPVGKRIVSCSLDNTVKVWNAESGQAIRTLKGHSDNVWSVAFSPDGKRIVSGSSDKTIKVWDAITGREKLTLKGHSGSASSVAFSPDGKRIVSGSSDKTIKVWDVNSGTQLRTFPGHTSFVSSVAFSPDGKRIVSGSGDKTVKVWDAITGRELLTLKGHTRFVRSVAFSPAGKWIVSGSEDRTLRIWDVETGKELQKLEGHTHYIRSVAFSPDEKWIVSGSHDNTLRIWDAETGKESQKLEGHTHWVLSVAFSPDGKRIVSGSEDNTIKVWTWGPDLVTPARKTSTAEKLVALQAAAKKQMTPAQLAVGDPVVNTVGMVLVPIPAGEFRMGSPDSDSDAQNNEKPQHLVKITKPFYLAAYEVTQSQYEQVMGARPWQGNQDVKMGPDYPAVYVSWNAAVQFCRKLSNQEGVAYRLPTEAEWEYACRAGTTTAYSFGNDAAKLGQYAWYNENAVDVGEGHGHRVGQKLPNPWGLYDMHGNVWEWCQDWSGPYSNERIVNDPAGPINGNRRVLRGGSFRDDRPPFSRSAKRSGILLPGSFAPIGFRAVRVFSE